MSAEVTRAPETSDAGEPKFRFATKHGANREARAKRAHLEHFQFEPDS